MSPELSALLRDETPNAPSELRVRVALIAAAAPPPRRTISLRRVLVFAAPAAVAASFAVALAVGIKTATISGPRPEASSSQSAGGTVQEGLERKYGPSKADEQSFAPELNRNPARAAAPAPSTRRAQDVSSTLRLLVDDTNDLSTTTQQALQITRRLGGYVLTVDYGTPEPTEGTATMQLRIPVSRVQAAVVQFSDLGRILAQQTRISDLQQTLDDLTRRIRRLETTGGSKDQIAALRRQRIELNRRAAYATVALDLTTHEPEQKAAPPGRIDRALDDATGILVAELSILAYALIVASPFLVLLITAFAGTRAYRRFADQRLLERA